MPSPGVTQTPPLPAELRFAWRALRHSPGFVVTGIVALSFAITVVGVVFSVVEGVLLRPLPYHQSDRLVSVFEWSDQGAQARPASYLTFRDWTQQNRDLDAIAFVRAHTETLLESSRPARVTVGYASPGFFQMMGEGALVGRGLAADDETTEGSGVIVLSHEFWARHFNSDRSVIGRTIDVGGSPVVVIGVMPTGFEYPGWAEAWRPLEAIITDPALAHRDQHADSRVIARVKSGASIASAEKELSGVEARLAKEYPTESGHFTAVKFVPVLEEVVGTVRPSLAMLAVAVMLVLAIACVNLANVSLVRGTARVREVAVRVALGATRWRIVRQLATEALILSAIGTAVGIGLTIRALQFIRQSAPFDLPRAAEVRMNGPMLAAIVAIGVFTAVAFGVLPALRVSAPKLGAALRTGRQISPDRRSGRALAVLMVSQFAIALLLLNGAGLLVQSFRRLQTVRLGFDPEHLVTLSLWPPSPKYDDPARVLSLYRDLIAAASAVPGVTSAAVENHLPLSGLWIPTNLEITGRVMTDSDQALYKTVTDRFLQTMRIPLLRGRWFSASEMNAASNAVVISEQLATQYWPHQDPVGQSITIFRSSQARADFGQRAPSQIIGVIGDVHNFGLAQPPTPEVYVPMVVEPWPHAFLIVRTKGDPALLEQPLARAVTRVDPDLPLEGGGAEGFLPVTLYLADLLAPRRYLLGLVALFGGGALLLAALGIYGVTRSTVAQRLPEFAVRIALGAPPAAVLRLVLRRGVALAVAGALIGSAASVGLDRLIGSQLYDTSPTDPATLIALPIVLAAVALLASIVPAYAAARAAPAAVLQAE
jgi:predicted permease